MTVKTNILKQENSLEIVIEGVFNFNLLSEFRAAYDSEDKSFQDYIINLRATTSLDSSALGMLLNMKRTLHKGDRDIRIINCQPQVKKVLLISRFDKKFKID